VANVKDKDEEAIEVTAHESEYDDLVAETWAPHSDAYVREDGRGEDES
jgi:hypothetical protein